MSDARPNPGRPGRPTHSSIVVNLATSTEMLGSGLPLRNLNAAELTDPSGFIWIVVIRRYS